MKNPFPFLTLTICLALAIFSACKKEEAQSLEEEKPIYWGTVQATVNDSLTWTAQCSAFYPIHVLDDSLYAFYFDKLHDYGGLRHQVAFHPIPLRVGIIKLYSDTVNFPSSNLLIPKTYLTTGAHYDLIDGFFYMNQNDTIQDFLEITEIDNATKEVKGRFQASYYINPLFIDRQDYFFPDTVVFRDCTFHAKYEL